MALPGSVFYRVRKTAEIPSELVKVRELLTKNMWREAKSELKRIGTATLKGNAWRLMSEAHIIEAEARSRRKRNQRKFDLAQRKFAEAAENDPYHLARIRAENRWWMLELEIAPSCLRPVDGPTELCPNSYYDRRRWNYKKCVERLDQLAAIARHYGCKAEHVEISLNGILAAVLNRREGRIDDQAKLAYKKFQPSVRHLSNKLRDEFAAGFRSLGLDIICRGEDWCRTASLIGMKTKGRRANENQDVCEDPLPGATDLFDQSSGSD